MLWLSHQQKKRVSKKKKAIPPILEGKDVLAYETGKQQDSRYPYYRHYRSKENT
jgi:hypothetical protein